MALFILSAHVVGFRVLDCPLYEVLVCFFAIARVVVVAQFSAAFVAHEHGIERAIITHAKSHG